MVIHDTPKNRHQCMLASQYWLAKGEKGQLLYWRTAVWWAERRRPGREQSGETRVFLVKHSRYSWLYLEA